MFVSLLNIKLKYAGCIVHNSSHIVHLFQFGALDFSIGANRSHKYLILTIFEFPYWHVMSPQSPTEDFLANFGLLFDVVSDWFPRKPPVKRHLNYACLSTLISITVSPARKSDSRARFIGNSLTRSWLSKGRIEYLAVDGLIFAPINLAYIFLFDYFVVTSLWRRIGFLFRDDHLVYPFCRSDPNVARTDQANRISVNCRNLTPIHLIGNHYLL